MLHNVLSNLYFFKLVCFLVGTNVLVFSLSSNRCKEMGWFAKPEPPSLMLEPPSEVFVDESEEQLTITVN